MQEGYWNRIKASLSSFWEVGQVLQCAKIFKSEGGTCALCGHSPITWHYVLRNCTTGQSMTVGRHCIVNYHRLTQIQVIFPRRYSEAGSWINQVHPGCVFVSDMFDATLGFDRECAEDKYELLDGLGLDPHDPDFTDLAPHGMSGDENDD